jgi:uncharacterized protein YqjF (DUF2071 family)
LLVVKGDPFLFADWERVVFLNFVIDPDLVRRHVPDSLELELYQGKACISLAAVTMRRFRPCQGCSTGWLFRPIAEQRFLNVRTYVRCGDEPGVLFIRGWLSPPFGLGLPSGMFGLPYAFASLDYAHHFESGHIHGEVTAKDSQQRLAYCASVDANAPLEPCEPGSLAEFAMERCTGFFCRGKNVHVFRAWHPPWSQAPLDVTIEDDSLITTAFPWFKQATLVAANFAPGFKRVWLGRAHRLQKEPREQRPHRALSTFFEMP